MKLTFSKWRSDLPAGLVVMLVALPLCLGISLASTGDPKFLFSGIISGVIGGIVVGYISGSRIGVSGPAAGLITIVATGIATLGSFEGFLVAVMLAGAFQLIAGYAKLGMIGSYFPSSVIKGMLGAIGLILILKEIPHALGFDKDFMGDLAFAHGGENTFSDIFHAIFLIQPAAIIISFISLGILIFLASDKMKNNKFFKLIPGPLLVVIFGILMNQFFGLVIPEWKLSGEHMVQLPIISSGTDLFNVLIFPDFSFLMRPDTYALAVTIALVGSLETLLSVEATDKLDYKKHKTPTNLELKAQGIGNMLAGFIGGLPVTQVIVRSTANVTAKAETKASAVIHGILLLIAVVFIPNLLNLIPLAALAAILLIIGYKLLNIKVVSQFKKMGYENSLPFIATIVGVILTDLLKGIGIGMLFAFFFILRKNFINNKTRMVSIDNKNGIYRIILPPELSFLNKNRITNVLNQIPNDSKVIIDGKRCRTVDQDVMEQLIDFRDLQSKEKNIEVLFKKIPGIAND